MFSYTTGIWQWLIIIALVLAFVRMVTISKSSTPAPVFENPQNGFREDAYTHISWLWVFLFGPLYWAGRGVWRHVFIHLILALISFGIAHFIYPFFTSQILLNHYQRSGWKLVSDNSPIE